MDYKVYYQENPTQAGRKCVVSFTTGRWDVQLIAYVGRVRVNYFMYIENMGNCTRLVPVTARWLKENYYYPFMLLKMSAGVRWYRGV